MEPRSTSRRRLGFAAGGSVANNFCWNRPRWIRSWSWVASSMINDNSYPAEMLYSCCCVCFHLFWRWNVWSDVIQRSRCVWIFGGSQKWQDVGFKTVNKTAVNTDAFGKIAGQYWWTQGAMGYTWRIWPIHMGMIARMGSQVERRPKVPDAARHVS